MEAIHRNKHRADPEQKWIRLQLLGLSLLLAIPVAITTIGIILGFVITGDKAIFIGNILACMIFGLATSGIVCFMYAHDKRQELKKAKGNE